MMLAAAREGDWLLGSVILGLVAGGAIALWLWEGDRRLRDLIHAAGGASHVAGRPGPVSASPTQAPPGSGHHVAVHAATHVAGGRAAGEDVAVRAAASSPATERLWSVCTDDGGEVRIGDGGDVMTVIVAAPSEAAALDVVGQVLGPPDWVELVATEVTPS